MDDVKGGVKIGGVLDYTYSNAPEAIFRLHLGGITLPVTFTTN